MEQEKPKPIATLSSRLKRPLNPRNINIWFTDDELEKVTKYCVINDITKTRFIRELVMNTIER